MYYHVLQSQAAHAVVAAGLRRKLDIVTGKIPVPVKPYEPPPLFPEPEHREMPLATGA